MFLSFHVGQSVELWPCGDSGPLCIVWEMWTGISYWSNAEVQASLEQLKAFMSLDADSGNEFIYNWLGQKRDGWAYAISLYSGFVCVCAVMDWAIPLWDKHTQWFHLFSPLVIPYYPVDVTSGYTLYLKHSLRPYDTSFIVALNKCRAITI